MLTGFAAPGAILIFPRGVRLPHGHPGLRQEGAGKPQGAAPKRLVSTSPLAGAGLFQGSSVGAAGTDCPSSLH